MRKTPMRFITSLRKHIIAGGAKPQSRAAHIGIGVHIT